MLKLGLELVLVYSLLCLTFTFKFYIYQNIVLNFDRFGSDLIGFRNANPRFEPNNLGFIGLDTLLLRMGLGWVKIVFGFVRIGRVIELIQPKTHTLLLWAGERD
jgi:hypothetical protein